MAFDSYIFKHKPSVGTETCLDICLWTLSVQRSKQFSKSEA